jgi:flagellar basal-body rod protein FlgB
MIETINPATRTLVSMALSAANARQVAHASNIAMAGVAGYSPVSVQFEQHLEAVRDHIAQGTLAAHDLQGQAHVTVSEPAGSAAVVKLDQEVAAMSQNSLHHQTLVKLLSRHYATQSLALDGGRR